MYEQSFTYLCNLRNNVANTDREVVSSLEINKSSEKSIDIQINDFICDLSCLNKCKEALSEHFSGLGTGKEIEILRLIAMSYRKGYDDAIKDNNLNSKSQELEQ